MPPDKRTTNLSLPLVVTWAYPCIIAVIQIVRSFCAISPLKTIKSKVLDTDYSTTFNIHKMPSMTTCLYFILSAFLFLKGLEIQGPIMMHLNFKWCNIGTRMPVWSCGLISINTQKKVFSIFIHHKENDQKCGHEAKMTMMSHSCVFIWCIIYYILHALRPRAQLMFSFSCIEIFHHSFVFSRYCPNECTEGFPILDLLK